MIFCLASAPRQGCRSSAYKKGENGGFEMKKPKIVILGAGYGGLTTAVRLQKKLRANEAEVVLINKNSYHYESTWLHEVAAGTLNKERACVEIRSLLNPSKINFIQDTVIDIQKEKKQIILENGGKLDYDYLVVSLGFESETFGIKGLREHAFSIRSVNSSRLLHDHMKRMFSNYPSEKRDEFVTIIVGGAGFTGIEYLGELVNKVPSLCSEYQIDRKKVRIICVEAAPVVMPGFDPKLVNYAVKYLEKRGVEFKIGTAIKECTDKGIVVEKDGKAEEINAGTVVWAAGVRGSSIMEKAGFDAVRGRVAVNKDLRLPNHEDVFVIGDCAAIINPENSRPYPPTAQISMQEAVTCAKNIISLIRNEEKLEEFAFDNKGTVCSLGEHDAIGVVFGKNIYGWKASVMKKVIDNRSLFLIGGPKLVLKKGKFNII